MAEIAAVVKPSRTIYVPHPFGLTFGAVDDCATQRAVVDAMLDAAESMNACGIRDTGFRWNSDDLRFRQLRKRRH